MNVRLVVLVLAFGLPGAVLAACGRDNALVGGECVPGYVPQGDRCVRDTDAPLDGIVPEGGDAGDGGLADGPNGDGANGDGANGDGANGDAIADATSCDEGLTLCNGMCVDTTSDPFNCGSCGVVCASLLCSSSKCVGAVAGHVVVIGHDYEVSYSMAQAKLLSNALLLAPAKALKVRSYEQYASVPAVNNVKSILNAAAMAANRTITYTAANQPSDVSPGMTVLNTDVLVVYDQTKAPASSLAGIGTGWVQTLASFTQVGGIVIVLDGAGGMNPQMPAMMTSAKLLDVASDTAISTGTALTVVAPQDAVGLGVVSPYGAGKHSVHFACNEANAGLVTYVVEDPTNDAGPTQPVTVHKVVP